MFELLSEALGLELFQLFGYEAASCALWMFLSLVCRLILVIFQIESWVPYGLIFASPYLLYKLLPHFSYMEDHSPLLAFRISEGILGRTSSAQLLAVIPAHFLGYVFGAACFCTLFGSIPLLPAIEAMEPIAPDMTGGNFSLIFISETIVVAIFVVILICIPELLAVNKTSKLFVAPLALPLAFLPVHVRGSSFNPCATYALWYIEGSSNLHLGQLSAPLLGGLLAGWLGSKVVPDDSSSWKYRNDDPVEDAEAEKLK